jgi:hypothetical protein
MVSHGRQKKDTSTRRKPKKGGKEDTTSDDTIHDMDLPEDFSIAGASSSTYSLDANDLDDLDDGTTDDADASEVRAEARQAKLLDALSLASTLSSEKRTAKREAAYKVIFKCVTQYADGSAGREILETNGWVSLCEACMSSLRGGSGNASPAEQYAACRVIEACSVVLGEDRDDVVEMWNEPLKKVVNATGRATQVRVAALRCLSMIHFICGTDCLEDQEDCSAVMDLCEKVGAEKFRGEKVHPLLRAAALDCWALLATTFHDARIAAGDANDDTIALGRGLTLLPLLASCLESTDVGLRSSAGECVAYIHECRLSLGENEAENVTERRFRKGSWDGSEWEVLMDEVKQRVAELSVESGHHMSKKTKKEQRAAFRDIMSTIVDDESPEEEVNFRGGKLSLTSWKEIIQLQFVRHCLQSGFQVQLMTNETLHDVFGAILSSAGSQGKSQLEKRLLMSKQSEASKAADRAMTKQRRTRNNVKNHFLTADGEDI